MKASFPTNCHFWRHFQVLLPGTSLFVSLFLSLAFSWFYSLVFVCVCVLFPVLSKLSFQAILHLDIKIISLNFFTVALSCHSHNWAHLELKAPKNIWEG